VPFADPAASDVAPQSRLFALKCPDIGCMFKPKLGSQPLRGLEIDL
jgi:hypothetical protein